MTACSTQGCGIAIVDGSLNTIFQYTRATLKSLKKSRYGRMTGNADILLKFIQGEEGKAWAEQHVGWKVSDNPKTEGVLCLQNE